jgi:hypothetical protein
MNQNTSSIFCIGTINQTMSFFSLKVEIQGSLSSHIFGVVWHIFKGIMSLVLVIFLPRYFLQGVH